MASRNFAINDSITVEILKIGCSEGRRLSWLAENLPVDVFRIESSARVVQQARGRGINIKRGSPYQLSFEGASFDVVKFVFLYQCDRHDFLELRRKRTRY